MLRGEVWWTRFSMPIGNHPALILTREDAIDRRRSVTVAPLTTTRYGLRVEVPVGPSDGLAKNCVINLDGVTTIEKSRLDRRICQLSDYRMLQVRRALLFALGFD